MKDKRVSFMLAMCNLAIAILLKPIDWFNYINFIAAGSMLTITFLVIPYERLTDLMFKYLDGIMHDFNQVLNDLEEESKLSEIVKEKK